MTRTVPGQDMETALHNAEGVLASAGHHIEDDRVADLVRQSAYGEISVDEMLKRARALLNE